MIKRCEMAHLNACAAIAFARNSVPENSCAYCSSTVEQIKNDFEYMITNQDCRMAGKFVNDSLTAILGCFYNPENKWVDCVGPFFQIDWNQADAVALFAFAKASMERVARYNFFFDSRNINCHNLMKELNAAQKDNEYILRIKKADYRPQIIKKRVVPYSTEYRQALIKLHDETFPNVYVSGKALTETAGEAREVFCALDDAGSFAGYGVLANRTAEIFAVKEEMRGQGFGWALLNTAVDSAFIKHKHTSVTLVVEKLNMRARNLYYSCGFKLEVENEAYSL